MRRERVSALVGLALSALGLALASAADRSAADHFFEAKVRPLLVEHCTRCHGPDKQKGGLRLDSAGAVMRGGESGPVVVPGKPDESRLVEAIRYAGDLRMPPKGELSEADVAALVAWVRERRRLASGRRDRRYGEAGYARPPQPRDRRRPHLLGLPPRTRPVAAGRSRRGLARLAARPLHPRRAGSGRPSTGAAGRPADADPPPDVRPDGPAADARRGRRVPGRRPSRRLRPARRPAAGQPRLRRALGAALARPGPLRRLQRHGRERRLRQRLALPRLRRRRRSTPTCPTTGSSASRSPATCSPPRASRPVDAAIIATGFLVLGPKMLAEDDPVKMEMDIIDEQIDTVGRVFLGLTLGCARCHDHKFDPIPTRDYYGLAGIFKRTRSMANHKVVAMWNERPWAPPSILPRSRPIRSARPRPTRP